MPKLLNVSHVSVYRWSRKEAEKLEDPQGKEAQNDRTLKKLLDKIGIEGKTFITDDWEGYHRCIPEKQLFTGKDLTIPIEQDNSNTRHYLARFRRK